MTTTSEQKTYRYDIIVIGGGPAGATAALRARELGARTALVERGRMGGTCTNDGCVPTRVLAHTARLLREAGHFAEYSLTGNAPELDFPRLMQRAAQVVYTMHEKKQLLGHLGDAGVEVFSEIGEARFSDPHTIALPDGRQLRAEKFILCAGGRARRLDFPGEELALTHSDVWSLQALPGSVIIAGAAATGCQLASIFAAFGAQVTLLDIFPTILRTEDAAVSHLMATAFAERGIEFVGGIQGITRIEARDHRRQLTYMLAGQAMTVEADAVILSTGWVGNLTGLNLPAAGVETQGPYVKVGDSLQTSAAHIYAAGDITGRMMLVQSAGMEALAAVENALLDGGRLLKHQIVPHGGFTDPEYGSVGLTEEQARAAGEVLVAEVGFDELDRAVIDGHTQGICKLIVSALTQRIVGVHVVGEQALEVVHMAAAGMAADMRVEQMAELQIAYPTYAAVIGLAARKVVRQSGKTQLASQWRSLEKRSSEAHRGAEWEVRNSTS